MKRIVLLFMLALFFHFSMASDLGKFFKDSEDFLFKYVSGGQINYGLVKRNIKEIQALYDQIGAANLSGKSDEVKQAFYINAYNLGVIYQVIKNYPIQSVMDKEGFFDKEKIRVAGEELTLNDLEKKKLLATYKDPRFHFVLVCAAKSCPPLFNHAYMPGKLNTMLNERTRAALNDPGFIRVSKERKTVRVSRIFEWYKNDFTAGGKSVVKYINQYRHQPIPEEFATSYYKYDWTLNRQ